MTDLEIERALLTSSEQLLAGHVNLRLPETLSREFGPLDYAFLIRHIPEQGEDLYTIVVPPDSVAMIEISRREISSAEILVEKFSLREFLASYRIPKRERRTFIVLEKLLRGLKREEDRRRAL